MSGYGIMCVSTTYFKSTEIEEVFNYLRSDV